MDRVCEFLKATLANSLESFNLFHRVTLLFSLTISAVE